MRWREREREKKRIGRYFGKVFPSFLVGWLLPAFSSLPSFYSLTTKKRGKGGGREKVAKKRKESNIRRIFVSLSPLSGGEFLRLYQERSPTPTSTSAE